MQKLDPKDLPADVMKAVADVEAVLAERFAGRRTMPAPVIGALRHDDMEPIYFVIAPPGMVQRDTIMKAALGMDKARERGADALADALARYRSVLIVECVHFVSGMPEVQPKQDARVVARDFLKSLQGEPLPLGDALADVGGAVLELLVPKGATLGKL